MSELSGLTVLVMEDDYYLADDASLALKGAGASVLGPYVSFDEAQKAIGERRPDCAILDINLGKGPDFTSATAMRSQGVPVLFVTGYDHATIPPDLEDVPCLQKPTTGRKIVQAVRNICDR